MSASSSVPRPERILLLRRIAGCGFLVKPPLLHYSDEQVWRDQIKGRRGTRSRLEAHERQESCKGNVYARAVLFRFNARQDDDGPQNVSIGESRSEQTSSG
jgi:hypothetical protein